MFFTCLNREVQGVKLNTYLLGVPFGAKDTDSYILPGSIWDKTGVRQPDQYSIYNTAPDTVSVSQVEQGIRIQATLNIGQHLHVEIDHFRGRVNIKVVIGEFLDLSQHWRTQTESDQDGSPRGRSPFRSSDQIFSVWDLLVQIHNLPAS